MSTTKKREWLLYAILIVLCINFVYALDQKNSQFSSEKSVYHVGDIVRINVSKLLNYDINIISNQNVYKFIGAEDNNIKFNPRYSGNYTVQLVNSTNNTVMDSFNFSVISQDIISTYDHDTAQQQNETNILSSEQKNESPIAEMQQTELATIYIYPQQERYSVGQTLYVDLREIHQNYTLYISSQTNTYQYLGDLDTDVSFIPKQESSYEIRVLDINDNILTLRNFTVTQTEEQPEKQKISIDKTAYVLGEDVVISLHNPNDESYSLTIKSGDDEFKFLGIPKAPVTFKPKKQGAYYIELHKNNDIIEFMKFWVNALQIYNESFENRTLAPTLSKKSIIPKENITIPVTSIAQTFSINSSQNTTLPFEMTVLQNDSIIQEIEPAKTYQVEIVPVNAPIEKITFKDLNLNKELNLGIDTVSEEILAPQNAQFTKVYAIDPSQLNFTEATVTVIASGSELWKCKEWNFSEQKCYGSWQKMQNIVPGQEYSFTLTPDDPGFAETGVASINTNKSIYHPGEPVKLIMVVLDIEGHLVSNASVHLNITNPLGTISQFSTEDSSIIEIARGIYEATYALTTIEGNYSVLVQAIGDAVNNTMASYFTVEFYYEFEILRSTPVTMDPWKSVFNSTIRFISYTNATDFDFSEVLSINFTITNDGGAMESIVGTNKILTWSHLSNKSVVSYSALPPLISPELYVLGPSHITYDSKTFYEGRPWFLAVDPGLDITLISPANNANVTSTNIIFIYNASDMDTNVTNCSLVIDNQITQTNYSISSGLNNFTQILTYGTHTWQVNCTDYVGNQGNSLLYTMNIVFKDLTLNSSNIIFSQTNPIEGETVAINATIFNIGTQNITDNFYVRFYDGDADIGGIQIGSDQLVPGLNAGSNITLNITWQAQIGTHNIYVFADATNLVDEANETNNNAYNITYINAYNIYYGESYERIMLDTTINLSVYSWMNGTNFSANIFVVDSDMQNGISWYSLIALGRNLSGSLTMNDFNDLDSALNMTNYNDSINNTYTLNGNIIATKNFTIYGSQINNTPIVNSTNTSAFVTGIVWDSSDPNPGEYNGSQDIVFITQVNSNHQGAFGLYDYEIKVPAMLRSYIKPNNDNTITFYTEIT